MVKASAKILTRVYQTARQEEGSPYIRLRRLIFLCAI